MELLNGPLVMRIVATQKRDPRACIEQYGHHQIEPKSDR